MLNRPAYENLSWILDVLEEMRHSAENKDAKDNLLFSKVPAAQDFQTLP